MGNINFTSLSSLFIFITFYLHNKKRDQLKHEPRHYLISETYLVLRRKGATPLR